MPKKKTTKTESAKADKEVKVPEEVEVTKDGEPLQVSDEYIIRVMQNLGFRKYRMGDRFYFLPTPNKLSDLTKITDRKARELFKLD